ncbi:cysteine proteinase [Westerdykella ornata]|uniref:Cysteine proteinase n=1 Tax=Westerdykella ornata TaxID=318751 RepID=A0A6A6JQF7_WESOR|nr:cysteine proteinase [Westerdykella ornata]KAF2278353.1 cysteine proteinase [Westerdykella ornata]
MMSAAERIKASEWTPAARPTAASLRGGPFPSSNQRSGPDLSSPSPPVNLSVNSSMSSSTDTVTKGTLGFRGEPARTDAERTFKEKAVPVLESRDAMDAASRAVPPAATIFRPKEPVSTRKRSNRESIIMLKASAVNGFKFPPWEKNPTPDEFSVIDGAPSFMDSRDLSLSSYQQELFAGWVRAAEALPPASMYPHGKNGRGPVMVSDPPIDLVQDAATDCSVVASLCAAVARAERGHDQLLSKIIWPYDEKSGCPLLSPNGKYVVRLNFNGCWRKVVIDDRLPVSKTHRLLHVIDRHNPSLLWPALIEKAYLKTRGGYDFPGSNSCNDLWTLTGWIPEEVYLQEAETVPNKLWRRIYNSFRHGDVLVTLGTGKLSHAQEYEFGLESQHSYVVLDMKETDDDRLFLVKNPWLEGKGWRGDHTTDGQTQGESLPEPTDGTAMIAPSSGSGQPTTFWIGLHQVIQHYERLYLNWNPGLFRHRQDIHFEWTLDGESNRRVGTCIANQPQFAFASKGTDIVYFLLSRHFRDRPGNPNDESAHGAGPQDTHRPPGDVLEGFMSISVYDGKGQHMYVKDLDVERAPYVNTPQCLLRWDPQAGKTYTVVIDQDEFPEGTCTFSLSAFSNAQLSLEPATRFYPCQQVVQGAWTSHTAGGDAQTPTYYRNPQYALEVRHPTSLAMLLTSTTHSNPLNVKLTLGRGKRVYRLQSRDVVADSGNYKGGCAFASCKDLQPGLYTVICSLFEAEKTGDYVLRVDSTDEVVLKAIPRDGAGLLAMKIAPARFAPGVHKLAVPIRPRRLVTVTMAAQSLKAANTHTQRARKVSRSGNPWRLSIEQGRGPNRRFLLSSEDGEYSDSVMIRTEPVDLEPSMLMYADMFVVIERLSSPSGPMEEWYEVEMLTDVPDAFDIGGWQERDN